MTITLGSDKAGAIFSNCGKYRYALWRTIDEPCKTCKGQGVVSAWSGSALAGSLQQDAEDCPTCRGVEPEGDCVFIGLNPSVANEEKLDPTTTRCRNYTRDWGYKRYVMLNIFSWIDTEPAGMKKALEPIGCENGATLRKYCRTARMIVACWGTDGGFRNRQKFVLEELLNEFDLYALSVTKGGFPHHPLYLATQEKPTLWRPKNV